MDYYKALLIIILAFFTVSSTQIKPLYAVTLQLDDYILRSNTCIFKTFPIPFTKIQYERSKSINVVGAISQLSMDQEFAYQLRYQILCPSVACYIDFALSRFTQKVREDFEYKIVIDFLVAENMLTSNVNMTFYKTDINLNHLISTQPLGLKKEEQNDWQIFLIPNGFNNVSMTGHVTQSIESHSTKLLLLYEDYSNGHGLTDFMGWTLNKNFILFKVIFVPKSYFTASTTCESLSAFTGFLSTQANSIKFNIHQNTLQNMENYNEFSLPIDCQTVFIDERKPVVFQLQARSQKTKPGLQMNYFYGIIPLLIAEVAYIFYKKKASNKDSKNKQIQLPDLIISFETTHIVIQKEAKNIETCETNNNIAESPIQVALK